MSDAINEDLI